MQFWGKPIRVFQATQPQKRTGGKCFELAFDPGKRWLGWRILLRHVWNIRSSAANENPTNIMRIRSTSGGQIEDKRVGPFKFCISRYTTWSATLERILRGCISFCARLGLHRRSVRRRFQLLEGFAASTTCQEISRQTRRRQGNLHECGAANSVKFDASK